MNISNVMDEIDTLIFKAKIEFNSGNDFQAERTLVKIREILNSQPELEGCSLLRPTELTKGKNHEL